MSIEFYPIKKCVFSVQIFTMRTSCVQFGNTIKKHIILHILIFFLCLSMCYVFDKDQTTPGISKNYERLQLTDSCIQKNISARNQLQ